MKAVITLAIGTEDVTVGTSQGAEMEIEGPLISDHTKDGELHVWTHDAEGNVFHSLILAPGQWLGFRWTEQPSEELRKLAREQQAEHRTRFHDHPTGQYA